MASYWHNTVHCTLCLFLTVITKEHCLIYKVTCGYSHNDERIFHLNFQSLWFSSSKDIGHMVLRVMDAESFCNVPQRQEPQLQKYTDGWMVCEYGSNCLKNVMIATFVTFYNKLGLGFCSSFSSKFLLGCFSKYIHFCNTDVTLPFKPTSR